jgi:hypothetical protein
MKRLFILSIILFLNFSLLFAGNYKKYADKSGKIEYELTGNTKGSRTLYWDDYGYKEITIENSITKIFGIKNETNSYTLVLGTDVYTWNDKDDKLYKSHNPIIDVWEEEQYDDEDLTEFGISMLESMGYEKTGSETVEGKNCDIWQGDMGKIWVWSFYNIKSEVNMMGMNLYQNANKKSIVFGGILGVLA